MEMNTQERHEKLIQFLVQFTQHQRDGKPRFRIRKQHVTIDEVKNIDADMINSAAILLADFLNLEGGSMRNIDLYKLLPAYLKNEESRKKINEVLENA